jgi:hypothetical protein
MDNQKKNLLANGIFLNLRREILLKSEAYEEEHLLAREEESSWKWKGRFSTLGFVISAVGGSVWMHRRPNLGVKSLCLLAIGSSIASFVYSYYKVWLAEDKVMSAYMTKEDWLSLRWQCNDLLKRLHEGTNGVPTTVEQITGILTTLVSQRDGVEDPNEEGQTANMPAKFGTLSTQAYLIGAAKLKQFDQEETALYQTWGWQRPEDLSVFNVQ